MIKTQDFSKKNKKDFDAEHFFDGYKANPDMPWQLYRGS